MAVSASSHPRGGRWPPDEGAARLRRWWASGSPIWRLLTHKRGAQPNPTVTDSAPTGWAPCGGADTR
eukprot:7382349-Prymnesium_polylepis.2